jgi:DNA-binding CsgD family transcriptional regulator
MISGSPQLLKVPKPPIGITHNSAPGWREYYREHSLHRYDPMHAICLANISGGLFTRKEALVRYHSPEAQRVAAEAIEFGVPGPVALLQWLGPGRLGSTSLFFPSADFHLDHAERLMLCTASFVFHSCYRELSEPFPGHAGEPPSLTPRESDVLHWIALGKTKGEIANLLQVSVSCVKRHCENILLRLGVNNMASAVARAMSWGLITI